MYDYGLAAELTGFNMDYGSCPVGGSSYCVGSPGSLVSGHSYSLELKINSGGGINQYAAYLDRVWMQLPLTLTPVVPTLVPSDTPTITDTPVPGTATATSTPTSTPVSIPGAQETAIPTSTECPGGCIVTALTAIPGLATRVTVDTSPFDPLKNLSLSRSSCQPFGYAQIPYPVIHGTPALGSTTPLSVTWTVPNTSTWNDSTPYSNTAIQPCAMVKEIPTVTWDITYWLSVLMLAIGYFLWLLGFVGRFSGDHSIDG